MFKAVEIWKNFEIFADIIAFFERKTSDFLS